MLFRIHSPRRGTVLVQFACFSFALLAIAGLAIDTGFVFLTQRQMNSAVDTIALEGLRNRDDGQEKWREKAQKMGIYLDTFQASSGGPLRYGSGPTVDFSGGIDIAGTDFKAAQTYQVGDSKHLAANIQPNAANNPKGDMVSGTFGNSPFEDPPNTLAAKAGNSFQVQLRRAKDAPIAGELSASAPVPYLFARATMVNPDAKGKGVSVRAITVADARPVLSIGRNNTSVSGVAPFALDRVVWEGLVLNTPSSATIDTNSSGEILSGTPATRSGQWTQFNYANASILNGIALAAPVNAAAVTIKIDAANGLAFPSVFPFQIRIENEMLMVSAIINKNEWSVQRGTLGSTSAAHESGSPINLLDSISVGQRFFPSNNTPTFPIPTPQRFVPIFEKFSGVERIIGFGLAKMELDSSPSLDPTKINVLVTRLADKTIVSENAAAIIGAPLEPSTDTSALMTSNKNFSHSLLAPALVR